MVRLLRDDFDTQAELEAEWDTVAGLIVASGKLRLDPNSIMGTAIRRVTTSTAIGTAYVALAHQPASNRDGFAVYLSKNGRHFTLATETDDGVWTVSEFVEDDGTSDYTDTGFAADGTDKTLGVRLLLDETVDGKSNVGEFSFDRITATAIYVGKGASTLGTFGLDQATATAIKIAIGASTLDTLGLDQATATGKKLEPLQTELPETLTTESGETIFAEG